MSGESQLNRRVGMDVVRLTEGAARAAAQAMGRGDEAEVLRMAAEGFRSSIDEVALAGRVVIGEPFDQDLPAGDGDLLLAPSGEALAVDMAVKLVECLTASALGGRNAMATLVVAPRDTLRPIPRVYMEKIACGPEARDLISFEMAPEALVETVAEAQGVHPRHLTVTILDRPRNRRWIDAARRAGARVRLIADGDLAGAIAAAVPGSSTDLLLGSGGALEGWLASAAIRGMGGGFLGRFLPQSRDDEQAILQTGYDDPRAVLSMASMLPPELVFSATGITDGEVLAGVRFGAGTTMTESLMVRTTSETTRWIRSIRRDGETVTE